MAYIKSYWNKKEENAKYAVEHTKKMEEKYKDEIQHSIENSKIYGPNFEIKHEFVGTGNVLLDELDSVAAVMDYSGTQKTAVLNFASYKNPGGMFINGSSAQEESLCKESFLYNVLRSFTGTYYKWNNDRKNKALYLDRAIYTPDVIFERNGKSVKCDVITCAAPNKSAAQKYQKVTDEENYDYLNKRIQFVLDIAEQQEVKTLILGAFGCGVFGQDPKEVAEIFMKHLPNYHFQTVLFAIPDKSSMNYKAFKDVLNRKEA